MDTVKSSADISRLFSRGRRFHTPYLTLILAPCPQSRSGEGSGRVAFIAGKRLGNAVWRSAAKRRMREVCRALDGPWPGRDVVFLAKAKVASSSYADVLRSSRKALEAAGIDAKVTHEA